MVHRPRNGRRVFGGLEEDCDDLKFRCVFGEDAVNYNWFSESDATIYQAVVGEAKPCMELSRKGGTERRGGFFEAEGPRRTTTCRYMDTSDERGSAGSAEIRDVSMIVSFTRCRKI